MIDSYELPLSFIVLSSGYIAVITSERKLTRDLNSVSDFFRYLLDEGILTECNVIILQYLMRTINRPDLEELCVQYATKDKKALCYYEDPRNKGNSENLIK